MNVAHNLKAVMAEMSDAQCTLVAVSKTKTNEDILEAHSAGHMDFGENKVQELVQKAGDLPDNIRWHMVGHLQRNKVKYIAPFIYLIHSVDSLKLLREIDKQALNNDRVINCLIQVRIAEEESKFGLESQGVYSLLANPEVGSLRGIKIVGLMGMGTFTHDEAVTRGEFGALRDLFDNIKESVLPENVGMQELSMGMTADYQIAISEGSTMVRIGSAIFGPRN